ncbi:MAG: SnoaL-like domain-containing protein, partial [Rhodospirillaceae bacterium]|nr:SnoaL-like domain-containing protein [Rhodospirillaceae bacterium]
MDEAQRMTIAKAYVDASNDHDVERIATMLSKDVAYRSSGVGSHDGAETILAMNRKFFADFPDVHRETRDWRHVDTTGVEFEFTITLGGQSHQGVERIFVGDHGEITRVEVERKTETITKRRETIMAKMTGARFLADFLERSGVTHVFWVPAVLMQMLREMETSNRISRILAHSEKAAVYMADGYARASGRPGVCFAQKIGAANLAAALKDPYLANTPLIAMTGGALPRFENRHVYQQLDDGAMFVPVTKTQAHVAELQALPEAMRQAFRDATTGTPGPAYVEIAGHFADVEFEEGDLDVLIEERFGQIPAFRPVADSDAIDAAITLLAAAERPVIVAGGGVRSSGAGDVLIALAERLGIPVATAMNAKDTIPGNHPLNIGVPGTYSRKSADQALLETDLVFFIGSQTGSQVTAHWHLPPPGTAVIQLDINAAELGRHYTNAVSMMGDARATLEVMLERADATGADLRGPWRERTLGFVADWRAEMAGHMNSNSAPIRPERICKELTDWLPENAILVCDTGHSGMWTAGIIDLNHAGQSYLRAAGSLGWGLPASIGAQLACPDRPVVLFTGDGGFWYHTTELETAVRRNAPVICVVNNNGSLNQGIGDEIEARGGKLEGRHGDVWQF